MDNTTKKTFGLFQNLAVLQKPKSEDIQKPISLLPKLDDYNKQLSSSKEQQQEELTKIIYDSAKKTLFELKNSWNLQQHNTNLVAVNKVKETIKYEIENTPENKYQSQLVSLYYDCIVYAEILKRQIDYGNFKASLKQDQGVKYVSSVQTQHNILEIDFHSLIFNVKKIIQEQFQQSSNISALKDLMAVTILCMTQQNIVQQYSQFCIQEIRGFFYSLLGYFKANHKTFEIKRAKRQSVSEETKLTTLFPSIKEDQNHQGIEQNKEKVDIHKNLEMTNSVQTGVKAEEKNQQPLTFEYILLGNKYSAVIGANDRFRTVDYWLKTIVFYQEDFFVFEKVNLVNSERIFISKQEIKQKLIGQLCQEMQGYQLHFVRKEDYNKQIQEAQKKKQEITRSISQNVLIQPKENKNNSDQDPKESKGILEENKQKDEVKDINASESNLTFVNSNQEAQDIQNQDNNNIDQLKLNEEKTLDDNKKELHDQDLNKKEEEQKQDIFGSVEKVENGEQNESKGDKDIKEINNENCSKDSSAKKNESNESSGLFSTKTVPSVVENDHDTNKNEQDSQNDNYELPQEVAQQEDQQNEI